MTLIKSISGIRGTLENIPGESLSNYDIEQFTLAYYQEIISPQSKKVVVIGRDARKSGPHIVGIVTDVLVRNGCDIIDLGLVTTPTLGVYTKKINASGGIMVSASHNDDKWNALKLLNNFGEFLSPNNVSLIISEKKRQYETVQSKGKIKHYGKALDDHINLVSSQESVSIEKISRRNFKVVVDGINSVGGIALPSFLEYVGVKQIEKINCDPNGEFAHNPEPLPENINDICNVIKTGDFDLGVVVDPDADRLCLVDENGIPFGEEYTLVAAAEHIISNKKNPITCSNLSSSIALKKITEKYSGKYFSAPVGEINVVETMKDVKADIGGEGNGGVIFPSTHYGRDSLVGIGLILTLLSERKLTLSELKSTLPQYHIYKTKTKFEGGINQIIKSISNEYSGHEIDLRDGIRINFEESWTHIRKSNTEPVVRVISEASTLDKAKEISKKIISKLQLV
tara:strand:- start:17130 stop:18494 length:1365 start_codon:yes stop_codon:yes gene_type:complete